MPDTHPPATQTKEPAASARDTLVRRPRRWRGGALALLALLAACGVAVWGITRRDAQYDSVTRWTDQQAEPTVAVEQPEPETRGRTVTLPGDIEAFYLAPIYARVSGYVKMWYHDIGDHVKAGDLLATIETPELEQQLDQMKADLLRAQTDQKLAETTAARWQALLKTNSVSVQATDEKVADANARAAAVNAARANLQRVQAMRDFRNLVAPFDGVVTVRRTDIGALINAGSSNAADRELFAVADIHRMRVYVRVPQVYSATITPGMKAELRLPQYPGRVFPATVATTANAIDPASRTVLVELLADNPKGALWPGTYTQVVFDLPADTEALLIPTSALVFREHGAQVATVDAQNKVVMKPIRVGKDEGTRLEVLAGLTAGDRIIDSPPDTLTEGETVRVKPADHAQTSSQ